MAPAWPADLAVRLQGVSVQRGGPVDGVRALDGVHLEIKRGTITALVGPNGAGKSTLLEVLAGTQSASEGEVQWAADLSGRVAWLPQRATLDLSFPISVLDTVMLGHWGRLGAFGRVQRRHAEAAHQALARVGLSTLAERLIGELSAGQLQRLLFARLLLLDRPVLLLDEPFAAVDAGTAEDLMRLLAQAGAEGRTVVYASHDLLQVQRHATHAALMAGRVLSHGPTAEVLTPEAVKRVQRQRWGAELVAA
jgi:zinc/manganese transport system ATP-binding protein